MKNELREIAKGILGCDPKTVSADGLSAAMLVLALLEVSDSIDEIEAEIANMGAKECEQS